MKLATIRIDGTTRAVRGSGDVAVELDAPDVGAVLARAGLAGVGGARPTARRIRSTRSTSRR